MRVFPVFCIFFSHGGKNFGGFFQRPFFVRNRCENFCNPAGTCAFYSANRWKTLKRPLVAPFWKRSFHKLRFISAVCCFSCLCAAFWSGFRGLVGPAAGWKSQKFAFHLNFRVFFLCFSIFFLFFVKRRCCCTMKLIFWVGVTSVSSSGNSFSMFFW